MNTKIMNTNPSKSQPNKEVKLNIFKIFVSICAFYAITVGLLSVIINYHEMWSSLSVLILGVLSVSLQFYRNKVIVGGTRE